MVSEELLIVERCLLANCLYEKGAYLDQPIWFFEILQIRKEQMGEYERRKNKLK